MLMVQLYSPVLSPYWLAKYVVWKVKWVWRYSVKGQEYSEEDRVYVTRSKLKLSDNHWKVRVACGRV